MILVSSCLCGDACKYNGGHNLSEAVMSYCDGKQVVKVCPEVLGGLDIPRTPAEIVGGSAKDVLKGQAKVITKNGVDVTQAFIQGAYEALKLAKVNNVKYAILKSNSPSCGKGSIYNGYFSQTLTIGNGVTTELLMQEGIEVITELDIC